MGSAYPTLDRAGAYDAVQSHGNRQSRRQLGCRTPTGEAHGAVHPPRKIPDPNAPIALGRPPEALGGWIPLIVSSAIVLAIMAVFYSPLGPLTTPDVFTGTYSEVAR
jgi:hypothetical protein